MVTVSPESIENLKHILANSLHPECLDSHPWTSSPIVQAIDARTRPGQRLVLAIAQLFPQMMPSTPVKRGKRLDSHWGEFGLLAAIYFAPIQFGASMPTSLRDAWGRIDQSILYFVYGKPQDVLSKAEIDPYKLVSDEPEIASISTLSDWHRKGLQRLVRLIQAREKYLTESASKPDIASTPSKPKEHTTRRFSKAWRFVTWSLVVMLLGLLVAGGLKVREVYQLAQIVRQDAENLRAVMGRDASRLDQVRAAGPALSTLRGDFISLKAEVDPYLWMGPWLRWIPGHGGDLASAQDLVTLVDSLLATADTSYQAILPLVKENDHAGLDLPRLTEGLLQAQPQLTDAQRSLELAAAARSRIHPDRLSPQVRGLVVNYVDQLLPLLEDGLAVGLELPCMLGATEEGPKTYLLLVQNEDELRPTGGFITAAGTLLLQDGKISSLEFSNSGSAEDWTKPYPVAPWQLREYMNSSVLIFRDTNWFTDYPTAAHYAENLYSYSTNHSVDGVIAFDQQMLVKVLSVTGPIHVEDVEYPVDASNVISYMRAAKMPTPEEALLPEWNNKAFLNIITRELMHKIFSGDVELEQLINVFLEGLDERHILLQMDNPVFSSVLEHARWDGAVRPTAGDFLMVVDTNIGFNKTNAVVASQQTYEVDLTEITSPKSSLTVVRTNNATGISTCNHWGKHRAEGERNYPIQDCYWNYLRVYTPAGTFLLDATPQSIPAQWMIRKKSPPAQVDILEEEIDGAQGFGAMQVVPVSNSLATNFQFLLPAEVIQPGPAKGQWLYHLRVQKQPGTLAIPLTIRVQMPSNATVIRVPARAAVNGSSVLLSTDLRIDLQIDILYQIP